MEPSFRSHICQELFPPEERLPQGQAKGSIPYQDVPERPAAEYDYGDGIQIDVVHILVDGWIDLTIERTSLTAILNMREFITQTLFKSYKLFLLGQQ